MSEFDGRDRSLKRHLLSVTLVFLSLIGSAAAQEEGPLRLASQVRELRPEKAALSLPVVVEGVVTMANRRSMVLQDESGGIFVLTQSSPPNPQPEPGTRWRVEGHTDPGDFSPIIVASRCEFLGPGALPPPRRPNWEEILSGSLDAESVEIEGILIAAEPDRIELLTRDGTTVIQSNNLYPLPAELRGVGAVRLLRARIKLRGVFASSWNPELQRLQPGVFLLGNASLSVIELRPADPTELPLVTVPDLWKFTSQSTALNRVRLRGRMMARDDEMLLLSDGTHGLRLASDGDHGAAPGDLLEVVGFARTGPISPVIVHPEIRILEHDKLPDPIAVDLSDLPDIALDAKLVRIAGTVVSDTIQGGERRIELQSGRLRFFATGPIDSETTETFISNSTIRVDGVYFAMTADPLTPGAESFEIRIAGDRALHLIASPPWWTTGRLLLLVAALLGGLGLVIIWAAVLQVMVRKKTSQLAMEISKKEHAESERALEQERSRVARDLHDELGAGLTEIGLLGSLVANPGISAVAKSEYLGTLGDVSRSLVSALDDIVWAINPDYDSVDDLAGFLWLHGQRLLQPAGIGCSPVQPVNIPRGHLGSRSRQSLLMAFKEALNNVIKHSHATHVDLGIRLENENVVVSISDNGIGMNPDEARRVGSQGIAGMRERMQDLGGECEILAGPRTGTVVNLILPLRNP